MVGAAGKQSGNAGANGRKTRQRINLLGIISLNIALITIPFSVFYIFYLEGKREDIASRNFRVLEEVGQHLNKRLTHFRALFQYFRITGMEEFFGKEGDFTEILKKDVCLDFILMHDMKECLNKYFEKKFPKKELSLWHYMVGHPNFIGKMLGIDNIQELLPNSYLKEIDAGLAKKWRESDEVRQKLLNYKSGTYYRDLSLKPADRVLRGVCPRGIKTGSNDAVEQEKGSEEVSGDRGPHKSDADEDVRIGTGKGDVTFWFSDRAENTVLEAVDCREATVAGFRRLWIFTESFATRIILKIF